MRFFSFFFFSRKNKKKIKTFTFRGRPPGAPRVEVGLDLRLDDLRRAQVRDAEHELEDAVAARDDGDLFRGENFRFWVEKKNRGFFWGSFFFKKKNEKKRKKL